MKKSSMKMRVAGLMVCIMLVGTALLADQNTANVPSEGTYIAIPMKVFKMLTEKPKKPEVPKSYIYQDGKLVECTVNYNGKVAKNFNTDKKRCCFKGKHGREFTKKQGDTVLLTVEQLNDLKKQKIEQTLKAMEAENPVLENSMSVNAKVNGKDVKVVEMNPMMMPRCPMGPQQMNPMMQPGFNNNMMPRCPMGPQQMNPMMQPGFNNNMMPRCPMGPQQMNPMMQPGFNNNMMPDSHSSE